MDEVETIDKEDIIRQLYYYARKYEKELENKNFMFVYQTGKNKFEKLEVEFTSKNFMHLVGIILNPHSHIKNAHAFYRACLHRNLEPSDFFLKSDGTTIRKLEVLSSLMNIYKMITMIGDFNYKKPTLRTKKLIGNRNVSIGFVKPRGYPYFVPNTMMQCHIKKLTKTNRQDIVAVFKKELGDLQYTHMCFAGKGINENHYDFGQDINGCIAENCVSLFSHQYKYRQEMKDTYKRDYQKKSLAKQIESAKKKRKPYNRSDHKKQLKKRYRDYEMEMY